MKIVFIVKYLFANLFLKEKEPQICEVFEHKMKDNLM